MMEERELFRWDELSWYSVLRDLVINLWVVVLAGFTVWMGVDSVVQLRYVPAYTSYATMAVTAKGSDISIYSNLTATTQMAEVIGEVFASNVLREKVVEELAVTEFDGEIKAEVIPETNMLTVQVTAPTAKQAHQGLWSAINHYDEVSNYLFTNADLMMLQPPSVPQTPSNTPNIRHIQKIASVGAAILVAAGCVLFTALRPTVQTMQGAQRNLNGSVLGDVPFERKWKSTKDIIRRRKKSILLNDPGVSMGFSASIRKIVTRLELRMKHSGHKILLVTSVGENEGKSSVATNIALALKEKGRRVLLLDGDLRKPAIHKVLQLPKEDAVCINDYLNDRCEGTNTVYYDEDSGLHVVQSGDQRVDDGVRGNATKICQLIQALSETMDYIIVDSAPMAVTSDTEYLLQAVESVLFVVRQDWCGVDAINDKLEILRQNNVRIQGIVLNAVHPFGFGSRSQERYYGYGRRTHGKKKLEAEHEREN